VLGVAREEGAPFELPQVPPRVPVPEESHRLHEVGDVRVGPVGLAPEEVQVHREGCAADQREHLHEPVRREFLMHGALVAVRRNPARDDLDEHRVDPPQILDVVDDVAGLNEPIEPVDHAAVRDAEHPREVVHTEREEGSAAAGLS
jgi:hypothetical protein